MKKLFLLFTALFLSLGISVCAQSPDNEQSPNRAPQATRTMNFSWIDDDGEVGTYTYFLGNSSQITKVQLFDDIVLAKKGNTNMGVQLDLTYGSAQPRVNYGQLETVPLGTYSVVTSSASVGNQQIFAVRGLTSYKLSSYFCCDDGDCWYYKSNTYTPCPSTVPDGTQCEGQGSISDCISFVKYNGTTSQFNSGSVTVEYGRHGCPYIYSTSLKARDNNTYNITIGDSRSVTTTYTSVTTAKADDYNKVILCATDGTNNLNLILDVASIDSDIYVPAGSYTIGSNVYGSLYDNDGYCHWKLKSGTITISKSGSTLSMTTSSLKATDWDGTDRNMNLTISNRTPTKKTIINVPISSATVNKESGYFNVIGSKDSYAIRIESAGVSYSTGYFAHYDLEMTDEYTYIKRNNSNISLDYNKQQAIINEVGGKTFMETYEWSTAGDVYRIAAFRGALYSITYKDQGNTTFSGSHASGYPTTHIYGTATTLATASKANYNFLGWYDNSACTGSPITTIGATAKTANFILYAKWESAAPPNYTVTYNAGTYGTGDAIADDTKEAGEPLTLSNSTYTRTGHTQTGWSTTDGGDKAYNLGGTYSEDADLDLYPYWEINKYTVTVAKNENSYGTLTDESDNKVVITNVPYGTVISNNGTTVTINGTTVTATPASDAAGYTYAFRDWTNGTATVIGPTTVTANFTRSTIPYTITYNLNDGTNPVSPAPATGYNVETTTITLPTPTKEGYNFLGWYANSDLTTGGVVTTIPVGSYGNKEFWAKWEQKTYTVTIAKNNNGYGTLTEESDNVRVINNVPYGTVITTGTGENANKVTINGTTVTATPAASDAQYSYAFSGWTNGAATVTDAMTVTANFIRTVNTYDITFKDADGTTLKKSDGTTDAIYTVAYGATPAYDGATPTKTADSEYTYTFNAWTPAIATVTTAATYTATYSTTKVQYTLTWDVNGGNELTGTYTSGTIDWGTPITPPADPTKAGYTFGGWDADNDGTADDVAAIMPTSDVTYKALWNAVSTDLVLKDGVTTGQTDINFDEFAATYNGQTMSSVTLNRTFTAGNWATICLPFYVDESQLTNAGLFRKVYEFRYATGSADVGDQVTFHFRVATSMEAGRGYLVKGTSGMGSSFVFNNVTINTSADTEADVNDLKGVNYYYDESVGSDIVIVGVLRSGTLRADGKKVMGLANNKIWYPHSSGNPMPAYRAYFYNPNASASVMPRVRIVVEGEGTTELEVVDGELYDAGGDRQAYRAPSKYIRNGVLIIERNGVRYDAQGKRI